MYNIIATLNDDLANLYYGSQICNRIEAVDQAGYDSRLDTQRIGDVCHIGSTWRGGTCQEIDVEARMVIEMPSNVQDNIRSATRCQTRDDKQDTDSPRVSMRCLYSTPIPNDIV
jgi:hypothetical protein